MQWSRSKKLDHFYLGCSSDSKVLDVGVSNLEHNDQVNLFLRNFRLSSSQYTGLAVESMDDIRKKYPDKSFVEYDGNVFPFEDKSFDWVFSNAVIEHVGDQDKQILFINEMLRVGKNVFFTTPNKYFPIESHTNVIFRHWSDNSFYQWCKNNNPIWSKQNLVLLGPKDLEYLMKKSTSQNYRIYKNRILGWPMTLTVVCS